MRPQDYFEYHSPLDIRVKGHRIGIEFILTDYKDGLTADEIVEMYPTLSLDEVLAVIAYYEQSRVEMDAFLHAIDEYEDTMRRQQDMNPPDCVVRLRDQLRERRLQAKLALLAPA